MLFCITVIMWLSMLFIQFLFSEHLHVRCRGKVILSVGNIKEDGKSESLLYMKDKWEIPYCFLLFMTIQNYNFNLVLDTELVKYLL